MPSADRVLQQIHGKDELDTTARQAGAFWQLEGMIDLLSHGRLVRRQLTPREETVLAAYKKANTEVHKAASRLYGESAPTAGANSPRVQWMNRANHYRTDKALETEILQQFFSPAWRDQFQQVVAHREQRIAKTQAELRAATSKADPGSITVKKPDRRQPGLAELEQIPEVVGTVLGALESAERKRFGGQCDASKRTKVAGTPILGTYDNGKAYGNYETVVIDFQCGLALFCGDERTFREYQAQNGRVSVAGITFQQSGEGALKGPADIPVMRTYPPTFEIQTSYELRSGGSVTRRSDFSPGPSQLVTQGDGWHRVQSQTQTAPGRTVKEPCKIGVLRRREP